MNCSLHQNFQFDQKLKSDLFLTFIRVVVSWFLKGTGRDIADFQYGCHCDVNSNHGQLLHGKPVDQIDIGTDFFMRYLWKLYHKDQKVNNFMIFFSKKSRELAVNMLSAIVVFARNSVANQQLQKNAKELVKIYIYISI